jgi:hypothetical protein
MHHHLPIAPAPNICELSTMGSIYVLAVLFFAPWRDLIAQSTREDWRRWLILGLGLLATQIWMTVSLPPWVGYPLLWHLVPPGRMVLAGGLLLLIVAFVIGQRLPLRFTVGGCLAFGLTLVLAWSMYKRDRGIGFGEAYRDWIFIVPVAVVAALQGVRLLKVPRANTGLIGCAAALGIVSFGTFNPIQSTTPIFKKPRTPLTMEFDRRLAHEGRGFLLIPWGTSFFSYNGMPLLALGYPSLAYATFDPAMDLWKKLYPQVPPEKLRAIFNNVGVFGFGDFPEPLWAPIYTVGPMAPFTRPGVTVCDVIRPSRAAFAPLVGCPAPAQGATAPAAR